jgi:hypothetical protein
MRTRAELAFVHRVFRNALASVAAFDRGECQVRFVTPPLAVCLAARFAANRAGAATFIGDSLGYATNVGLMDALRGQSPVPQAGALSGRTYSPLTRVQCHADVEPSNAKLNGLLRARLAGYEQAMVDRVCKVVGELNNNVASHSQGFGFSAAQVYEGRRLLFAVADSGRGFLHNVRKAADDVRCHDDAIGWAFVRGNTSAGPRSDMGQRWAPSVDVSEEEDNHQGLGLAILEELVRLTNGSLWVISGDSNRAMFAGEWVPCDPPGIFWQGVALGLEIPLTQPFNITDSSYNKYDDLKRELGL